MFIETVDQFAKTAVAKSDFLRRSPLGFTISSMMAGAYVGLGIILIFCVGNAVDPSIRPILCNWLVCLAIWTSARMTNDTAKCIAIFWCLYAFIASGFEHSVANMTLLSIALMTEHPASVSLAGLGWNLLWVTIGNAIAGAGIMGLGYWAASRTPAAAPAVASYAVAE